MSRPRPMLVIALVLLPGLACGLHSPLSPLTLLLPACLLLWGTSVGCLVAHHRCADLALMATLFCVAALWSRSDQLLRERLSLDRLFETTTMCAEPLPVTLTGRIASEVVPFGEGRGIGFELDCRRAQLPDGSSLAVHAPVAIRLYGRARQRPLYREQWSLRGSLARAEPRWRTPCRLSGGVRGMQRHASRANYWALLCLRLRRRAAVVLAHDLEAYPGVTSIIHAMTLGYRKQLSPPIRELFSRVGAAHLFAVARLTLQRPYVHPVNIG